MPLQKDATHMHIHQIKTETNKDTNIGQTTTPDTTWGPQDKERKATEKKRRRKKRGAALRYLNYLKHTETD